MSPVPETAVAIALCESLIERHLAVEQRPIPSRAFMKYGWDLYAPDAKTRDNPYVSPLRVSLQDLHGLPPALVITSENDPLRDEGEAHARKRFSTRRCLWRWRRAPCPS